MTRGTRAAVVSSRKTRPGRSRRDKLLRGPDPGPRLEWVEWESRVAYFAAAGGGAGNSASWKTLISQRPFCLVIVTIMRPLRGGTSEPSAAFVPVMTVSASTVAIWGVKKRMLLTVPVRLEAFRLPLKREANQS